MNEQMYMDLLPYLPTLLGNLEASPFQLEYLSQAAWLPSKGLRVRSAPGFCPQCWRQRLGVDTCPDQLGGLLQVLCLSDSHTTGGAGGGSPTIESSGGMDDEGLGIFKCQSGQAAGRVNLCSQIPPTHCTPSAPTRMPQTPEPT